MKETWTSDFDVTETRDRLTLALMRRSFGVLHIHNIKATLNSKGVSFEPECEVLEVCNPIQAAKVLREAIEEASVQ